jgi:hypothetical protein
MKNINMNKAKKVKNDEFYTRMIDIQKELSHYREQFNDKIVFCNCNDSVLSCFYQYFDFNFDYFNLKKIISVSFNKNERAYKLEIVRDKFGNKSLPVKSMLSGNGDFRDLECIDLLEQCDIVCTNPPFSLFREYINLLNRYDKRFLIIGNNNAITYKEIFRLIKDDKLRLGYGFDRGTAFFKAPFESSHNFSAGVYNVKTGLVRFRNVNWFTNLNVDKDFCFFEFNKASYYENLDLYSKCDNCDVVNVNSVKDIPCDYSGVMCVPITFLNYYDPKYFKILNIDSPYIGGKRIYKRIFIQRVDLF